MARRLVLTPLLLAFGCTSGSIPDPSGRGACRHVGTPSDADVRACFDQKHNLFAELAAKILSTRTEAVGTDRIGGCWFLSGSWGCGGLASALEHNGLTPVEYQRYLDLFMETGVYRLERLPGAAVGFAISRSGIVTSGTTKGLLFTAQAPSPIVADTDRDRPSRYTINYALVDKFWYIEHASN